MPHPPDQRPYSVLLQVTRQVEYIVLARSRSEAQELALEKVQEGQEGLMSEEPVLEVLEIHELHEQRHANSDATGEY
jgi:hypothetical protein